MAYPNSFIVGSQAAMLSLLDARINDICFRTDLQQTFILAGSSPSNISSWEQIAPPVSSGAEYVQTYFNVKNYGAKGDTKSVTDAVTSGSNTVTSATANFSVGDIGKQCFAIETASGVYVCQGTIASVISSTQVTINNGLSFKTGFSLLRFVWGTDDTVALKAAWTAAQVTSQAYDPSGTSSGTGVVYVPAGGYLFSSLPFVNTVGAGAGVSLLGDGPLKTVFYPHLLFTFTNTLGNALLLWNYSGEPSGNEIGNFSCDGSYITYAPVGVTQGCILDVSGCKNVHDIIIREVGGASNTSNVVGAILAIEGMLGVWENILAQAITGTSSCYALYLNGASGTLINCTGSNSTNNAVISGVNGGTSYGDDGGYLTMVGCLIDEGDGISLSFINSSNVSIFGGAFFGNANSLPVNIDATSEITFVGSFIGAFSYHSTNNTDAVNIASGGIMRAQSCRIRSYNEGTALINAGTFYDLGGNSITNLSGSGSWVSVTTNTDPPPTGLN